MSELPTIPRVPTYAAPMDAKTEQWCAEAAADIIAQGEFKVVSGGNVITTDGDGFKVTKPDGQTIHLK